MQSENNNLIRQTLSARGLIVIIQWDREELNIDTPTQKWAIIEIVFLNAEHSLTPQNVTAIVKQWYALPRLRRAGWSVHSLLTRTLSAVLTGQLSSSHLHIVCCLSVGRMENREFVGGGGGGGTNNL